MTNQQKETITQLRSMGHSYAKIATLLGISENTVKSFCRRNNLAGVGRELASQNPGTLCRQCKALLIHTAGAKQKRFCSDKCRMTWWNAHPEAVSRKAFYPFTCDYCGANCESYGNKKRKYCSRACYGKSKAVRHE
jgi:hypothetical protein